MHHVLHKNAAQGKRAFQTIRHLDISTAKMNLEKSVFILNAPQNLSVCST
jgi:hypothetical protein